MIALCKKIEYVFNDIKLLEQALTHSSCGQINYEKLEFLGDAVLELVTSDNLYRTHPDYSEGELTKLRAEIVCEESLSEYARTLSIAEYMLLGKGEKLSGGREKPSILADMVEAIIGAIYLDGGISNARAFINKQNEYAEALIKENRLRRDYKSKLQEILQKNDKNPQIDYRLAGKEGTDHNPVFITSLYVKGRFLAEGKGKSKKISEQNAAKAALNKFDTKEQL